MLKDYLKKYKDISIDKLKRSEMGVELAALQRQLQEKKQSVVIFLDGFESSGRATIIKDLIRELDPRHFKVDSSSLSTPEDKQYPFLWRFFRRLPMNGNVVIFDRSIYFEVLQDLKLKGKKLDKVLRDLKLFEELLLNDNTILIKYFLIQSKEVMKERVKELQEDKKRHFFVDDKDLHQLKKYDEYLDHFNEVIEKTDTRLSPWNIVVTDHIKNASRLVLGSTINLIKIHFEKEQLEPVVGLEPITEKPVTDLDLSKKISDEDYDEQLDKLQEEASDILYEFYDRKLACSLVFEGTDAAGKGGSIKRLTRLMDPRMFQVATVSAPTKEEINRHYLWRFYRELPRKGHLTIFDRSWYGRVMVERLEKFTPLYRTQQAYDEINRFEKTLVDDDMLVLKFLLVIDKDEQRKRFEDRQNTPEKQHKLTDEDWRNHEKFEAYQEVMDEMIVRTNTNYAPWFVISSQQKKYARIEVLKHFIKEARDFLNKHD